MEKAYAKLYKVCPRVLQCFFLHKRNSCRMFLLRRLLFIFLLQSYEALESGFVDQALVDLTGGVASRISMTDVSHSMTRQLFPCGYVR